MATYKVRDPTGAIREIKGPDGATDEEVIAQAKLLFSATKKPAIEDAITRGARDFNADTGFAENALAGAGKAFSDLGRGVTQFIGYGPSRQEIDEIAKRDAPLMDTGGGITGNIAGNVAAMLPAAAIPGVNTVLGGAALGVASGALSPVGENESRLERGAYGGAFGAMLPAALKLGSGVYTKGRNLVDSLMPGGTERLGNRMLNTIAGDRQAQVLAALRANTPAVPGSAAIAGEAAVPAGSAEFSALQNLVKYPKASDYDAIEQAQKLARVKALQTIGGRGADDTALNAAIARRTAASAPLYQAVEQSAAKVDAQPVVDAVKVLLVKNKNEDAISVPMRKILDDLIPDGETLENNPQALASLSKNIKAMLGKKTPDGQHEFDVKVLTGVKELLDRQIGQAEIAYTAAREAFKTKSGPINRMNIGQVLENKLANATGKESPAQFLNVLDDPALAMKKATGFPRYKELGQVLQPDEVTTAKAVGDELSRNMRLKELSTKGMESARKTLGILEPEIHPTGMFSPILSVSRGLLNRALGKADDKAIAYLSQLMKDPQATARAMEIATPAQRSKLLEELAKFRNPALIGAPSLAVPGLLGPSYVPQSGLLNTEE